MEKKKNDSYLLHFAIPRANKRHGVAAVVVRRHRGHAIVFVDEERGALDGAGSPQRLVEVLAAEVIVYLQRLEEGRKDNSQTRGSTKVQHCSKSMILRISFHHITSVS